MERSLEGKTEEDSGASMKDIVVSLQRFGVCPDADMPYNPADYKTPPTEQAKQNALFYQIGGGKLLKGLCAIQTALALRSQPVLIGMKVYASMESAKTAQTGVLPMPGSNDAYLGRHAVLAVGYLPELPGNLRAKRKTPPAKTARPKVKKTEGYLIVRNSWGKGWGDGGYFYMPAAYVEKGLAFEAWIMEKIKDPAGAGSQFVVCLVVFNKIIKGAVCSGYLHYGHRVHRRRDAQH